MSKEDAVRIQGIVKECLPGSKFSVMLTDEVYQGKIILGHLSGKMRMHFIKIIPGDMVEIEITPYDINQGRIVFRDKGVKKPTSN